MEVIIDEVDTIGGRRGGIGGGGTRALDSGLNVLLQKLDGVDEMQDVLVVCITNRPDMLDEAFTRSGRIGKRIHVGKPDAEARQAIFEVHLRPVRTAMRDVNVQELVRRSDGLVGADIKEVVRQATAEAFADLGENAAPEQFAVRGEHLRTALDAVLRCVKENQS